MTPESVSFSSNNIPIAAHLFHPASTSTSTSPSNPHPAIVVSHPFGGVKEQTAGLYAKLLSQLGFLTLAFDAAYQGASGGEPRYLENPHQRAEDIKSAVSYLTTRADVDPSRIGALGICASGGYVPFAASTDTRIKAVATVSAVDTGHLFREGLKGTAAEMTSEMLTAGLQDASAQRTSEAAGQLPHLEHIVPNTPAEVQKGIPALYAEGTEYYRTVRAQHPNSANWYVARSLDYLATYSSYEYVGWISPRPLLMVAGSEADTRYFSEDAVGRAKEPKELFVVKGKTHIDLYDQTEEVVPKLAEFMGRYL